MDFHATMTVPRALADMMNRCCRVPDGQGDLPFFETVVFSDGRMMDITVVPDDEPKDHPHWTQGVLYERDDEGDLYELTRTEVLDSLTEEYTVFLNDDEYTVVVEAGDVESIHLTIP